MVSKYRRTAQPNDFSGDPLNVANAGTAQRLQDPSISIPRFQNPPGAVSSAKKESITYTSSRGRFDRLAEHFDLSRVSWADLHKSHRVLPRGTSIWNAPVASSCIRGKEWNPGCRVQIFCRSTLLLLFQVSATRTTVGERRQQVTKEDETCTRRWSNSRHGNEALCRQ